MTRLPASIRILFLIVFLICGLAVTRSQTTTPVPATPLSPITAILDAFESHRVIALSEGDHGNLQGHAFRLALVRDPRFARTVNDIVVEFGNSLYQDVMDDFVRGQPVPGETLRRVWQNTTQPFATFDLPIYEEFFRAVRAVNATHPLESQLRVVLGDPPIDWAKIHTREEAFSWLAGRDSHPADLISREVLAKGRRALVIYGGYHLIRKRPQGNGWQSIVNLVERSTTPTNVFTVATNTEADLRVLQPAVAGWQKPSLAMLRGTALGAVDFNVYFPFEKGPWSIPMEDEFDALLYLGAPSEITHAELAPELCADSSYRKMRTGRLSLAGFRGDSLCAAPDKK